MASVTVVTDQKIAKSSLINAADLVLIDVTAIRLDITILLRLIHDQQPELPIIVVTTSPTWQRSRQAFLAGATDYIRKSFRPERIRAACTATWSEIELPE
ncbi:response regulator [Chloroflexi bacterium TSY]|nr:response regulator [Chloroflexi bacterium TSY]